MGMRGLVRLGVSLLVAATAAPASADTFGAALFTPAVGAPYAVPDVEGISPVRGAPALTLTRATDASSAALRTARASGAHLRTVSLAWSTAGVVRSLCLRDVAVTSYSTRGTVEHATLFFASAAQAVGTAACSQPPAVPAVVVRLFTDPGGGLNARVDCLAARCVGRMRVTCPKPSCPTGGLGPLGLTLGAGQERVFHVPASHGLRGSHPRLAVTVALRGSRPGTTTVTVDPPPPVGLPLVTSAAPSPAVSPTPAGAPAAPAPGAPGSPTAPPGSPSVPVPPSTPAPAGTSLTLSCVGGPGAFTAVDGVLGPGLAGAAIEVDYVPTDPTAEPIIHFLTTGAGGQFHDASGVVFKNAIAFFAGNGVQLAAHATCP